MGAPKIVFKSFGLLFKAVAILLMFLTPLLGVWVSSSIAVFANEGLAWAIGAGLLMFPLLPVLWESWAAYRRKRKKKVGPRYLNLLDRLVLRTLVLNAVFLGALLATQPKAAFTALSARGDWMLGEARGPTADKARALLFRTADGLSWLYEAAADNPFRDKDAPPPPGPGTTKPGTTKTKPGTTKPGTTKITPGTTTKPGTTKPGTTKPGTTTRPGTTTKPGTTKPDTPKPDVPKPRVRRWPQSAALHAIVARMTAAQEKSPQTVGRHIAAQTDDAFVRARAVHDFVANRIAYDAVALANKRYPPQDANTVLKTRLAVCAGYAKLYVAIARAAGLEAVYLTGHGRQKDGGIDGIGHAWNAVRLAGKWYLLDATWDSGFVKGTRFMPHLRTVYFLTPPEVFGADHFPDDPRWQLRAKPLTRGQFIRQPFLRASFYASGLRLLSPRRPQVTTGRRLTIRLQIPAGTYALASPRRANKRTGACKESSRGIFACRFPTAGRYTVHLCVSPTRYGSYRCVGKVLVNSDQ